MITKDEALKLALKALENITTDSNGKTGAQMVSDCEAAITAIKQARSAPVQEPVVPEGYTLVPTEGYEWVSKLAVSALAQQALPLTELQKDAANLLFALHDAWPYVHGHCTIESRKKAIQALMVKHGDFADLHPPAAQRQCDWPTCQSEEYQHSLAEQIKQELVTGSAQRQWVGLTDDEVDECYESVMFNPDIEPTRVLIYQAIEDKLKEKNT